MNVSSISQPEGFAALEKTNERRQPPKLLGADGFTIFSGRTSTPTRNELGVRASKPKRMNLRTVWGGETDEEFNAEWERIKEFGRG